MILLEEELLILWLQFILLRARSGIDVTDSHHERPRSHLGHLVAVLLEEGLLVMLLVLVVVLVAILSLLELGAVRLKVGSVTTLKAGTRTTPPLVSVVVIEAGELLHNQRKVLIIQRVHLLLCNRNQGRQSKSTQ